MEESIPDWWADVHRCRLDALNGFESVLDALDASLSGFSVPSSRESADSLKHWFHLLNHAGEAHRQLARASRLYAARCRDAEASGKTIPGDETLDRRIRHDERRIRHLSGLLRQKMGLLTPQRKPHRPKAAAYRKNPALHVDLFA